VARAGVGGGAARGGGQGAVGGLLAFFDRLAGGVCGEHLVVLDLVHVDPPLLAAVAPLVRAGDRIAEDVGHPLGAQDVVLGLVGRVDPVPAMVVAADVVGILIDDGEVSPDIPILGIGARLAAGDAPASDRRLVAGGPAHGVDAVHGLLDDVVAGEPAVVVPVAHLVLHVGAALLARLARVPDSLRVVGRLD